MEYLMEQERLWEGWASDFLATAHDKILAFYATPYATYLIIVALCLAGFTICKNPK